MAQFPGRPGPKNFIGEWCLPAFLGGFAGGVATLVAGLTKSAWAIGLFGIAGGNVGLMISAQRNGAGAGGGSPWKLFWATAPFAVGLCYISIPATLLALAVFR